MRGAVLSIKHIDVFDATIPDEPIWHANDYDLHDNSKPRWEVRKFEIQVGFEYSVLTPDGWEPFAVVDQQLICKRLI